MKVNLILVDDHRLFREALSSFLSHTPDIRAIGQAESDEELFELLKRVSPDLILLDLDMPRRACISCAERLSTLYPAVPVLGFSMNDTQQYSEWASTLSNVRYCLTKTLDTASFLTLIRSVGLNSTVERRQKRGRGVNVFVQQLTRQEIIVLKMMLSQLSNEEIAMRLTKSLRTI